MGRPSKEGFVSINMSKEREKYSLGLNGSVKFPIEEVLIVEMVKDEIEEVLIWEMVKDGITKTVKIEELIIQIELDLESTDRVIDRKDFNEKQMFVENNKDINLIRILILWLMRIRVGLKLSTKS